MPYQNSSDYKPPLPPRSPRPSFGASSSPGYSQFPSQQAGLHFSPGPSSGPAAANPPPVPPRPLVSQNSGNSSNGYFGPPSPSSPPPPFMLQGHSGQGYSSFPPPPKSPNRLHSPYQQHPPPALPPRPHLQVPTSSYSSDTSYTPGPPIPTLSPSALSPNQLTSFPPPPPGPPPLRTSPSTISNYAVLPHEQSISTATTPSQQDNGGFRSKLPLLSDPPMDPEIPSSPPPAYSPMAEPGSQTLGEPTVAHSNSIAQPVSSPGIPPVASPPLSSPCMALPSRPPSQNATTSIKSPPILRKPVPSLSTTSSGLTVSGSVSNPESPDALSFFPRVTPMPQRDPIEELMNSMSLSSTPASELPSPYGQNGGLYSGLSTPAEDPGVSSTGFDDVVVAPLRPPKTPLTSSTAQTSHSISGQGEFNALLGADSSSYITNIEHTPSLYATTVSRENIANDSWSSNGVKPASYGSFGFDEPKIDTEIGVTTSKLQSPVDRPAPNDEARSISRTQAESGGFRRSHYDTVVRVSLPNGERLGSPEREASDDTKQARTPIAQQIPLAWKSEPVVKSCIDTPMTFATTWYYHPDTSDFLVCSRCYTDHILCTQFSSTFQNLVPNDGKPRVCRFSKPRMRDHVFPRAVVTSYLQPVIDYMRRRSTIPDCRGADGVLGSAAAAASITWYIAADNTIPGFLACEACYEDYAASIPSLSNFIKPHHQKQGPKEIWACDFALPFIQKQYDADGKTPNHRDGWRNFSVEAKSRIGIARCSQTQSIRSFGKKWFQPISGPDSIISCAACYCDQVIHTGEESKWRIAPGLTEARDMQVRCSLGGRFNIRVAMAQAHEIKDFTVFWNTIRRLESHKTCEDDGVQDAVWWTLPHDPKGFQVCGACYIAICEPLSVSSFFSKKVGVSDGAKLRCCFNIAHPRLRYYMPRLLEMYFTHNPTALVEYAKLYADIQPCSRDNEVQGARWYGWEDCKVCAECYQDFARHHQLLADQMTLRNTLIQQSTICEMYSSQMRQLYLACSRKPAADPSELLQFAQRRRQIYYQTVPQMKQIIQQQKLALGQQRMLNSMSSFYTNSGQIQQITNGSSFTYSAPGLGTFKTMDELQGAAYGSQAMGIVADGHGALGMVKMLEQQWRAVE